jgi:O-antigen/teichoic acid export membrane protein
MARTMRLSGLGQMTASLGLLYIFVIPANRGHENAAIRFIAVAQEEERGALLSFMLKRVLKSSAAVSGVLLMGAATCEAAGQGSYGLMLVWVALFVPGFALVRLGEGTLRGAGSIVRSQITSGVLIPGISAITLVLERLVTHQTLSFGDAAAARLAAILAGVACVAAFGRRTQSRDAKSTRPLTVSLDEVRHVARGLTWLALLNMVISQIDVPAVSVLRSSSEAGIYSVAARTALVLNVASVAVNFTLAPRMARHSARGDFAAMRREILRASGASIALVSLPVAALFIFPHQILHVFGGNFADGTSALYILAAAQVINAVFGPVGTVLNMSGHQHTAAAIVGAAAVGDLAMQAILTPAWGLTGAATATTCAITVWNIGMAIAVVRIGMLGRSVPDDEAVADAPTR